ncbi:CidA/LrgA family protein [Alicyclobacillus vulcanalis]|uniref:Holin-like protein n=1 Tax=Alicyclobacillus vulcanalis TaxID=252246 RepID=A0A1N7N8S9_9BACL|nr:CidA/LrgA family protein [Alicyclobacillus vulcanalis]SIS94668.1 holin-like protein [Alicyclobacillus vulcanalis]
MRTRFQPLRWKAASLAAVQIAALYGLAALGNVVSAKLHLPVPGSIIGVVVLFGLLRSGLVKVEWIERGADLLIGELLLFFIPSSVGVIAYAHLFRQDGLKLLAVVAAGTVLVMLVTGSVAEVMWRLRNRSQRSDEGAQAREANAS